MGLGLGLALILNLTLILTPIPRIKFVYLGFTGHEIITLIPNCRHFGFALGVNQDITPGTVYILYSPYYIWSKTFSYFSLIESEAKNGGIFTSSAKFPAVYGIPNPNLMLAVKTEFTEGPHYRILTIVRGVNASL